MAEKVANTGVSGNYSHAPEVEVLCLGETMCMITPTVMASLEAAVAFSMLTGGAESNVAIHLAALGHGVRWASRVGDDALGRRLVSTVAAAGVDTSLVEMSESAPTGVYFKDPVAGGTRVLYYRSGSAASTMDENFFSDAAFDGLKLLHLSGITPALSPSCHRLTRWLLNRERSCPVSFDINYRSALWSPEQAAPCLRELAQRADVVFVGLDEANTLWGAGTAEQVREVLAVPRTLVVKDSDIAAYAFGERAATVTALEVEVVEPVGAGDAFAAGYLAGLLREYDATRCLRFGHVLAAQSLLSTADNTPVPSEEELTKWLSCPDDDWHTLSFEGSADQEAQE